MNTVTCIGSAELIGGNQRDSHWSMFYNRTPHLPSETQDRTPSRDTRRTPSRECDNGRLLECKWRKYSCWGCITLIRRVLSCTIFWRGVSKICTIFRPGVSCFFDLLLLTMFVSPGIGVMKGVVGVFVQLHTVGPSFREVERQKIC